MILGKVSLLRDRVVEGSRRGGVLPVNAPVQVDQIGVEQAVGVDGGGIGLRFGLGLGLPLEQVAARIEGVSVHAAVGGGVGSGVGSDGSVAVRVGAVMEEEGR